MANPYAAPTTDAAGMEAGNSRSPELASGQKLVIYAILLHLAVIVLQFVIGSLAALGALVALVMSLIGVWRLGNGLGYGTGLKILLLVLMFVPLVSLIILLVLSGKATSLLRADGYKVGLLGASKA